MKRILLPTLYDTRGGSTRVLLAAAEALRRDHAVTVRAPLPEADEPAPGLFPARPLSGRWRKIAVVPRLIRLVAREALALRRLRPDVIYVHDEPALHVYGLAARFLRPRPFVLWHLHRDWRPEGAATARARLADACIRITAHASAPPRLPCALIRNPLHVRASSDAPPAPLPNLAVIGAIYPLKGQDLAVEVLAALRRYPEGAAARLTLIGPTFDPAFAEALRRRIAELDLGDAVVLAGERPAERTFDGVGLALFPSHSEVQPLALAEALARGLPVAATDIPGHRAMFMAAGADPADLSPRDPEAFARAILKAAAVPVDPEIAPRIRALHAPEAFAAAVRARFAALFLERDPRPDP